MTEPNDDPIDEPLDDPIDEPTEEPETESPIDSAYRSKCLERISASSELYRGENVIVLSQIKDVATGEFLKREDVESISATLFNKTTLAGQTTLQTSFDWNDFTVDNDCVIELTKTDSWTPDEAGFNFLWVSDQSSDECPDFVSEAGDYILQFTFHLTNGRPPATLTVPFTAK